MPLSNDQIAALVGALTALVALIDRLLSLMHVIAGA